MTLKKREIIQLLLNLAHIKTPKPGMVPMARLELARLSPLPPQDSVSTNSTTSACLPLRNRGGPLLAQPA